MHCAILEIFEQHSLQFFMMTSWRHGDLLIQSPALLLSLEVGEKTVSLFNHD
jgi:hypothetical protein